jgi:sulfate adenylyltransferase
MNKPLGGILVDRIANARERRKLSALALPKLVLPKDRVTEVWNISTGAYSPLTGFLGKKELRSVLKDLKLSSGTFWPIPIVLDIDEAEKKKIGKSDAVFLADPAGKKIAHLCVEEIYPFPKRQFESQVFKTHDLSHPGVYKVRHAKKYLIAGKLTWIGPAPRIIRPSYTPREVREMFQRKKWRTIVAFHTRNVPHLGHEHIQREGLKRTDGLLVQPLVGAKKSGDFRNEVVAKAYRYFVAHVLPRGKAILSFLPYNAYFAGPREALLTAVIRKNFGCTHFIIGRDHTGVGDFYTAAEYSRMIQKHQRAMGITILHFSRAFYCLKCKKTVFEEDCPHDERYHVHAAGSVVRDLLLKKSPPPPEMIRPEVVKLLLKEKDLFVR